MREHERSTQQADKLLAEKKVEGELYSGRETSKERAKEPERAPHRLRSLSGSALTVMRLSVLATGKIPSPVKHLLERGR